MKKIRFFLDPISEIKPWLNKMSDQGYRLVEVNNFIYEFEESKIKYYYETQFIGNNSFRDNNKYIEMLKDAGKNIFRAPINQGNITLGKLRFRPLAEGDSKFANTFMDYNKEILIVESTTKEELLTDYVSLASQYKKNRNGYLQGLIILVILLLFAIKKLMDNAGSKEIIAFTIVSLVFIWILSITVKNHRNYKKYDNLSKIQEGQ